MKKTLYIYILKEMIPNFATSLLVFTFLVLAGRILRLTEWMINHGVHLVQVILITIYTIPYVFFYTLPMSTLLASIIAFSRLNEDNEIIALRSSGTSFSQLIPPVITFSVMSYLFASMIAVYLIPVSNHSLARLLFEVAKTNTSIGIKEGVFNDSIPNIVMYANHISPEDQAMEGVFIFDERDPSLSNTIIAHRGEIYSNPQQMSLNLHLVDGSVYMVNKKLDTSRMLQFTSYNLKIDLEDIMDKLSSKKKGRKEMSISELRQSLNHAKKGTMEYNKLSISLHRKFSIPFSCILLGFIGLPLGLTMIAKGKSWGIALSISVFLVYYTLLTGAYSLGETGKLSPELAVWIPNIVLGIGTLLSSFKVARNF